MRLAVLVGVLALVISAQSAAGVETGNYTVLEGPAAGTDIFVGGSGSASILDRSVQAKVVPADDNCNGPYLVGVIDGKSAKPGGCGWGRVLLLSKAPPLVRDIANAITEEERAAASILALATKSGERQHWELALYGQLGVEHALEALTAAESKGDIPSDTATKIRRRLDPAHTIDEKLKKQMQADKTPTDATKTSEVRELRNALSLKREAFTVAVDAYGLMPHCTAEKPFDVFAVPAGYTGSYNDVFPHGIPKGATNVKVSFIDTATGKAPGTEIFPGQTWSVEVKGLQPDGKFAVRVNVTGTGFGKPDANSKHWKVVVSFDCP